MLIHYYHRIDNKLFGMYYWVFAVLQTFKPSFGLLIILSCMFWSLLTWGALNLSVVGGVLVNENYLCFRKRWKISIQKVLLNKHKYDWEINLWFLSFIRIQCNWKGNVFCSNFKGNSTNFFKRDTNYRVGFNDFLELFIMA